MYKLYPMDENMRKLSKVRKLWEGILELSELKDVFIGESVITNEYDIDHFIPWSCLLNDELWNLMPMDSSLNGTKNNKIPKWNLLNVRDMKFGVGDNEKCGNKV